MYQSSTKLKQVVLLGPVTLEKEEQVTYVIVRLMFWSLATVVCMSKYPGQDIELDIDIDIEPIH